MGCACIKSDGVVKNQKICKDLSNKSPHKNSEGCTIKKGTVNQSPLNYRNQNSNNVQIENLQNMNNNSSGNQQGGGQRNQSSLSNQQPQRQSSSQNQLRAVNNRLAENLRNEMVSNNNVVGSMPHLQSNSDPNFNFRMLGK